MIKNKIKKAIAGVALAGAGMLALAGCTTDADTASRNISTAAESFEVQREVVVINGITGATVFYAEGRCSVESAESFLEGAIEVTCKYGPSEYRKHFVMMGDQDSISITQSEAIDVSEYHTRVILKPQNAIPEFDISVGEDG